MQNVGNKNRGNKKLLWWDQKFLYKKDMKKNKFMVSKKSRLQNPDLDIFIFIQKKNSSFSYSLIII